MENTVNASEMIEKLSATRKDFVRSLVLCVANADSCLATACKDGVISPEFENMFNVAAFYLQKIKETDFSLSRLSVECKALSK